MEHARHWQLTLLGVKTSQRPPRRADLVLVDKAPGVGGTWAGDSRATKLLACLLRLLGARTKHPSRENIDVCKPSSGEWMWNGQG